MTTLNSKKSGPLSGYKVIELAGIGPGPYAGQLLSDLGADVISVVRPGGSAISAGPKAVDQRGKRSVMLDLRKDGAAAVLLKMVESADILLEGNRPGVTERLGIGPADCHKVNPKLVYGRMTGWGQSGPWAKMAGHDLNYLSITGALDAIGRNGEPPMPPLNLVGDYGGGTLFLVVGVISALLQAEKTGQGDVVDAAIIDGVSSMMGIVYSLSALGMWSTKREGNLLDGAMPFYRCYKTSDDKFMAIGCIEPQFFALMLGILGIDAVEFGPQHDPRQHASQHQKLEAIYASKTRDEWAEIFDGSDACVTPVLNYKEATTHPQNRARGGLTTHDGMVHPGRAPAFDGHDGNVNYDIATPASDTVSVLQDAGFSAAEISDLISDEIAYSNG